MSNNNNNGRSGFAFASNNDSGRIPNLHPNVNVQPIPINVQRPPNVPPGQPRVRVNIPRNRLQHILAQAITRNQQVVGLEFPAPNNLTANRGGHARMHPPNRPVVTANDYLHSYLDKFHDFIHKFCGQLNINTNKPFKDIILTQIPQQVEGGSKKFYTLLLSLILLSSVLFFIGFSISYVMNVQNIIVSLYFFLVTFFQNSIWFPAIVKSGKKQLSSNDPKFIFLDVNYLFFVLFTVFNTYMLTFVLFPEKSLFSHALIFSNYFREELFNQLGLIDLFWISLFSSFLINELCFLLKSIGLIIGIGLNLRKPNESNGGDEKEKKISFACFQKRVKLGKIMSFLELSIMTYRILLPSVNFWIPYILVFKKFENNRVAMLLFCANLIIVKFGSIALQIPQYRKLFKNWSFTKYGKIVSPKKDDEECSICKAVIRNPIELIDCKHVFCYDCISKWYKNHNEGGPNGNNQHKINKKRDTCPLCRKKFYKSSSFGTTGHTLDIPIIV